MPKPPERRDPGLETAIAAREEFEQAFRRSKRGNLWRHWEGKTLVVFGREDGFFSWSISDADGPRYSREAYETEEDALSSLASELEVGLW